VIRNKTVFVVGAGASFELGFPLGSDLLKDIAGLLDLKSNYSELTHGDYSIWKALAQFARVHHINIRDLQRAAWRVRDAAHLGLSIDNVIHQQNDDDRFALCSKLGIAKRILVAESKSHLRVPDNSKAILWPEVRKTWLGGFAQLLVQDKPRAKLDDIFDNVSVVCFNYDRTIRRFLPLALASQYAIGSADAEALALKLPIYHPYGSLGRLPWEGREAVEFGNVDGADLLRVASNIRTFTESELDPAALAGMSNAILGADRIVFLGFGYLAQNMRLLTDSFDEGHAKQVLGTSVGLSKPDVELVEGLLGKFFPVSRRSYRSATLSDAECAKFIQENFRTLTS